MAASDPRNMGPSELCRLVNSTPLGYVLSEQRLTKHRNRAGLRIANGNKVDLVRYAAWLVLERHERLARQVVKADSGEAAYERHKHAAAVRQRQLVLQGRDIGPIPGVKDPARKAACRTDFGRFCRTYFPHTFTLPWSDDHRKVIAQIEESILLGGLFATAMPRGSGKTTLCEVACIFAGVYGHRRFLALIGSSEEHALTMLDSIKAELETNELLLEDFPEVVYPIHRLEGISNRCHGQICEGKRTHIGWSADEVVLPTIEGSPASGVVIKVAGITGTIRGLKFKRSDGATVRPELVVIDDPQTDESARSPSQCVTRERILAGAILGLAGPDQKISGIMPCTVIRELDMADNILNRDKHPEWNGTRTQMVYQFPDREDLWDEYERVYRESLRAGNRGREATELYVKRRKEMDAGAVVAWEARYNSDEVSALQHAMNLKIRDLRAFWAEYQNKPLPEEEARPDDLTADQIANKVNNLSRGVVPVSCNNVTAFIDVQGSLLYYLVAAWEDDFTGYVLDYGTFPDQKRAYFTLHDAKLTLADATPGAGLEGRIYNGLKLLCGEILGHTWPRQDGASLSVERCLIDANWQPSTATVYKFCRESPHSAVLTPSRGKYYGAASLPMGDYKRKTGERVGLNWRVSLSEPPERVRWVLFDTNFWKSFLHARLCQAIGDRGTMTLFGERAETHRLFADHLTSEYRVATEGRGRKIDEWKPRPERFDNHFLDCAAGALVAASMLGVCLPEVTMSARPKRKVPIRMSELQAKRRQINP